MRLQFSKKQYFFAGLVGGIIVVGVLLWILYRAVTEEEQLQEQKPLKDYTAEEKKELLEELRNSSPGFNYSEEEMRDYLQELKSN